MEVQFAVLINKSRQTFKHQRIFDLGALTPVIMPELGFIVTTPSPDLLVKSDGKGAVVVSANASDIGVKNLNLG